MHHSDAETAPLNPFFTTLYFGEHPPIESIDSNPVYIPTEGSAVPYTKTRLSGEEDIHRVCTEGETTRISIPRSDFEVRKGLFTVILPDRRLKEVWDVIYDLLILYSLCTSTYYLAFQHPGTGLYAFDVCVWVFFVLDVLLTFNTAYLDEDDHPVTSRKAIALHYLFTWFFIDLVALLPFSFGDLEEVEYYLRLVRFLRLPYSVNFVDGTGLGWLFSGLFKSLPDLEVGHFMISYYHISLIFQQISRMILLSYFLAALYYWFAKHTGPQHVYGTNWFEDSARLTDESEDIRFLHSWYYMMTTLFTIGYGDFLPVSFYERIIMIPILFIGITNFSLILSTFVSLISQINDINSSSDLATQASSWLQSIQSAGHQISPEMKSKVITYFAHYGNNDRLGPMAGAWWQADSVQDLGNCGDEIFNGLQEQTQREIIAFLFSDIFAKYRFFFGLPQCNFAYEIAIHFQPRIFHNAEIVLEEGEEPSDIFLLTKGKLVCEFHMRAEHQQFLYFDRSVIIGDYPAFTNTPSKFTFRAIGRNLQMLAVPLRPFIDILEVNYPTSHKKSLFQRAAQFNNMLIRAQDAYLAKKDPSLLLTQKTSKLAASVLLRRVIQQPPLDSYAAAVSYI